MEGVLQYLLYDAVSECLHFVLHDTWTGCDVPLENNIALSITQRNYIVKDSAT